MTLSPCRTLQNVIQTQKCVLCRDYAKPNRCVFKCFAKASKPKEEYLKSTGKAFQLLGPATAKDLEPQSVRWLGTTMSPWAADLKAGTVAWWYRLSLGMEQVVSSIPGSVPCSLSLRLLGSLRVLWVLMAWHKNCVKKKKSWSTRHQRSTSTLVSKISIMIMVSWLWCQNYGD